MDEKSLSQTYSPLLLKYLRAFESNRRSRVFAPLAETYRKMGMLEKALEVCREGLKHNPQYVLGHLVLAQCYHDLNQKDLCFETLRPFVEEHRDNIVLQKLYVQVASQIGENDEALQTAKYLLFVNPKDNEMAQVVKNLEASENKAVQDQTQSIQKNKSLSPESDFSEADLDEWSLVNLGENSQPHKIEESFETVDWSQKEEQEIEKEKDLDFRTYTLDQPAVESDYVETQTVDNPPLVTHTLVDLYCAQGLNDKAVEVLEKILELNPQDQRTAQRLAELKTIMNPKASSSEQSDREKLMGLFDKASKSHDIDDKERYKNDLMQFLNKIKNRSQQMRSKPEV